MAEVVINDEIDKLEEMLLENFPLVDCPLKHTFVPGMYIREIFMPKGTVVTSMIHKTKHPYFVMDGVVLVCSENDGEQLLSGGDSGITLPNTRRVLQILEDTIWITCHVTDIQPENDSEEAVLKAVDLITDTIIEKHENKLLGGVLKNNVLIKSIDIQSQLKEDT